MKTVGTKDGGFISRLDGFLIKNRRERTRTEYNAISSKTIQNRRPNEESKDVVNETNL